MYQSKNKKGAKTIEKELHNFEYAVMSLLEGDGLGEALFVNELTAEQRKRFDKIKGIYLEECLKDCPF